MNNLSDNNNIEYKDDLFGLPDNDADFTPNNGIMKYIIGAAIVLVAGLLYLFGLGVWAIAFVGGVAAIYGTLQSRFAFYVLLASLPLEWLVAVNPEVTSVTKLIAVWVLLMSLTKLLRAIFSGRWDPCAKWILLLIGWSFLSILWARDTWACFYYLITMVLVWSLPLLFCIHLNNRKALQIGLAFYIIACLFSCIVFIKVGDIYSLTGTATSRSMAMSVFGAKDVYYETNLFPRFFALVIFICIYFIMTLKNSLIKVSLALIVPLMCIGIILAKGRMIYIAVPGALLAGVILLGGGGISKRALLIIVVGILAAATIYVAGNLGLLGGGIEERFQSIFAKGASSGLGQRKDLWGGYLRAFLSSGGFGKGLNQVRWSVGNVAHNDWIDIMGDLGLIGLFAFFGLHFCLFRRIMRVNHIWSKLLCLTMWSFIILAALTETDYLRKYYTMAIGLIIATVRIDEAERAMVENIIV
jgi:hypothetical protein